MLYCDGERAGEWRHFAGAAQGAGLQVHAQQQGSYSTSFYF
jgi:hypothetical protein